MKHVLLIALKPSIYLLFIYIEYGVRILAMNIGEKLRLEIGDEEILLRFLELGQVFYMYEFVS